MLTAPALTQGCRVVQGSEREGGPWAADTGTYAAHASPAGGSVEAWIGE